MSTPHPGVAVFDAEGPPGVAFIRSLGSRGVPVTAYSDQRHPAGRHSRYVSSFCRSPSPIDGDRFIDWLTGELTAGRVGLVAPTSDYVAYAAGVARERAGVEVGWGAPNRDALWNCLHKGEFGAAMARSGFPTLPYALPRSTEEALAAGEALGYPLMLKPRSHVGIGLHRGAVAHDASQLAEVFAPNELTGGGDEALSTDPDLAWPLLQRFHQTERSEIVSISGCLGRDGEVLAVGHCRKLSQWPPEVGIGTLFESLGAQDFTDAAVAAARDLLECGLFEIEVCVDRSTGEAWPIDLNPRAYGQVSLEIARGNDLPALWYQVETGTILTPDIDDLANPELWVSGAIYYVGSAVKLLAGPDRSRAVAETAATLRRPRVGATAQWTDPLPALVLTAQLWRHPGSLIRPFLPRSA